MPKFQTTFEQKNTQLAQWMYHMLNSRVETDKFLVQSLASKQRLSLLPFTFPTGCDINLPLSLFTKSCWLVLVIGSESPIKELIPCRCRSLSSSMSLSEIKLSSKSEKEEVVEESGLLSNFFSPSNSDSNPSKTSSIQLIPDPMKTNLSTLGLKDRRRRGTTELQNLEFNVNYDRRDCSRGKGPIPWRFSLGT